MQPFNYTTGVVMRCMLITLICAAALGGCATHLVPMSETTPVPKERILAQGVTTPASGRQRVTVVRNAGALFAGGVSVDVLVDGDRTAAIRTSEALSLYLPPGEHLLTTKVGGITASVPVMVPGRFPIYRIDMTEDDMKLQSSFE